MLWEDERYVRVYVRDTADWMALSFDAQALFLLLLRKVDRIGVLPLGRMGRKSIAVVLGQVSIWPRLELALDELVTDGCVLVQEDRLLIRNFVEAQETVMSGSLRTQEWRKKKREMARGDETSPPADEPSTKSDEVRRGVTRGDSFLPSVPSEPNQKKKKPCTEPDEAPAAAPRVIDTSPVVALLPVVGKGPNEYPVTEAKVSEWSAAYPGIDVLREVKQLVQWARDNPTRRKTYRGAPAFFSRNLARKQDSTPKSTHNQRPVDTHDATYRGLIAELDRQIAQPGGLREPDCGPPPASEPLADLASAPGTSLSAAVGSLLGPGWEAGVVQDGCALEHGSERRDDGPARLVRLPGDDARGNGVASTHPLFDARPPQG